MTDLVNLGQGRFTGLYFSDDAVMPAELVPAELLALTRSLPLHVEAVRLSPQLAELFGARHGSVYLVRPDGHVLGRWHDATAAQVRQALATILTREAA